MIKREESRHDLAFMAGVIIGALQTLGGETGSLYTVLEEISAAIATAIGG